MALSLLRLGQYCGCAVRPGGPAHRERNTHGVVTRRCHVGGAVRAMSLGGISSVLGSLGAVGLRAVKLEAESTGLGCVHGVGCTVSVEVRSVRPGVCGKSTGCIQLPC